MSANNYHLSAVPGWSSGRVCVRSTQSMEHNQTDDVSIDINAANDSVMIRDATKDSRPRQVVSSPQLSQSDDSVYASPAAAADVAATVIGRPRTTTSLT